MSQYTVSKFLDNFENSPDIVITGIPPEITGKIVDERIKFGTREIWMQPGSESQNAIRKAKESVMKVIHNACIMADNGIWQEE